MELPLLSRLRPLENLLPPGKKNLYEIGKEQAESRSSSWGLPPYNLPHSRALFGINLFQYRTRMHQEIYCEALRSCILATPHDISSSTIAQVVGATNEMARVLARQHESTENFQAWLLKWDFVERIDQQAYCLRLLVSWQAEGIPNPIRRSLATHIPMV